MALRSPDAACAPVTTVVDPVSPTADRRASLLLLGLLAVSAYACFASGAVGLPEEPRVQVALCALALAALVAGAGGAGVRLHGDRRALLGTALLAGFAAWAALSILWSVAPDRSWQMANRSIAYVLVVLLGLAIGTSSTRAVERVALGWLAVALAVASYALGGKALPGLEIPPLLSLDNTGGVSRLRAPLEYWNALALVCVLAAPVALRVATDATRSVRWRTGGVLALWWLLVTLGMTYSRGGFLALAAAAAVLTWLGGARVRGLAVLGATFLATTPVLAAGFGLDGLASNTADLAERIVDGRVFLLVLVLTGAALTAGWLAVLRAEPRLVRAWTPRRARRTRRAVAVGVAAFACLTAVNVAGAEGGWREALDEAASSFTESSKDPTLDPVRLASTNSGNRWAWWNEAAGGFAQRPLAGWGAGSFPLVHRRFRVDEVPVLQPHNVPLQFLVETGLVGGLLAMGGLGLLLAAGVARVRGMAAGRERDLAVALLAGAAAWCVHAVVDWDWDIPAVTLPMLLFLGVLGARPARGDRPPRPPLFRDPEREGGPRTARLATLAVACLALAAATASAALPAWSDAVTSDAVAQLGDDPTEADLEDAAAGARLGAKLDPLAIRPLVVSASIAQGRGRLLDARRFLLEAADRAPEDPEVWIRVARVAIDLADREGLRDAARRALRLDPANGSARALATRAEAALTPPQSSATAVGTPLPLLLPGTPIQTPTSPQVPPAPAIPGAVAPPAG
jgi:O-antigen ligase